MKSPQRPAGSFRIHQGITVSGHAQFQARNVAVGDRAAITDSSPAGAGPDLEQLNRHFAAIESALATIPPEMAHARATIEALAASLKQEAEKPKPNPMLGKITATGLVEAAKSVASAAPSILSTAKLIAGLFL